MRNLLLAAGLAASFALAGCQGQVSEAEATPAPEKSLARTATMYSNQDWIQSIQAATVEPGEDGAIRLKVTGTAPSDGWSDSAFLPRIYAAQPPDGIYEIDVIANQPATPAAQVPTPIEVSGAWDRYTDGRVKGVKFISKTNSVVAMVAPPAGAPAAE